MFKIPSFNLRSIFGSDRSRRRGMCDIMLKRVKKGPKVRA